MLDKICTAHPTAALTLILNNAPYQRCKEVAAHARVQDVELLYLPAYSPNLNLIERLWKLTKKKYLRNRHYLTLNFQFFLSHKTS